MKQLILIALVACTHFATNAFAADSEEQEFTTIKGIFVEDAGCAETGYALQLKSGSNLCVGFHSPDLTEKDLVVGQKYNLGGYLTEDGFFITEFAN